MRSTGAEVVGTDNTLSRSGCRVSNDLSAFTAAHGSQSCATVPASTVSRYLIAAFLTDWMSRNSCAARGDVHTPQRPEQRLSVNGFEDRVFEAKARQPRDQGQDHTILSSSSRPVLEDTIPD